MFSNTSPPLLPLAHPQRRIWFTELIYPGTGVGNLAGCVHFASGEDQLERLGDAIRRVLCRHDALRLRLARTRSAICEQYFGPPLTLELPIWDVDETRGRLVEESKRPLPLYDTPLLMLKLLRFAEGRIGYYFKYHHINTDAWSVALLNREICDTFLSDKEASRLSPAPSYAEFLRREQGYLCSDESREDERFWHEYLANLDLRSDPPIDTTEGLPTENLIATRRYEHEFQSELSEAIVRYCEAKKVSVFRFFLATFARHLAAAQESQELVIGTGHHNRLQAQDKEMVGMTVSTVPLRFLARSSDTFESLLQQVHARSAEALSHQQYPFDLLSQQLRAKGVDPRPLLRYSLNHIPSFDGESSIERYSPGSDLAGLSIKINPNQRPRSCPLQLGIDAQLSRYSAAAVADIFDQVEDIAKRATRGSPSFPGIGAPPERLFSRKPGVSFWKVFERTVKKYPNETAIVEQHGKRSYRELHNQIAALRHELFERGVRRGTRVPVITDRSGDFVVAILSVLSSGAAFVPITPDTPLARQRALVREVGAPLVLCDQPLKDTGVPSLEIWSCLTGPASTPPVETDDGDIAYIIFTSGSTGQPKGVMVPHKGLVALSKWLVPLWQLKAGTRVASYQNFMFDGAVAELFTPLSCGATICVMQEEDRGTVRSIERFLDQHEVAVAVLPTKVGELFQETAQPSTLRLLMVGGEKLFKANKRGNYRVLNGYGPTETTVYASVYELDGHESDIPIGKAPPNLKTYVVDKRGVPVKPGEIGELWVAGNQVAAGYLNQPKLTEELFVPNPFSRTADDAIAYRTGDQVWEGPDGNLRYVGRRDRQIKLRGYRIDLAEVEGCILSTPGAKQCHVEVQGEHGEKRLVAYCVGRASEGVPFSETAVTQHVSEHLPRYMRPSDYVLLPQLPLAVGGKVDTEALRASERSSRASCVSVPPGTWVEGEVLELFRTVLKRETLDCAKSFFELGGDSLSAMVLFLHLERRFGYELPVSVIFQNSTVQSLAKVIESCEVNRSVDEALVVIRKGAEKRGIFCVHDLSCELMSYTCFSAHLNCNQPVYGLRWPWQGKLRPATLEDVAAQYLQAIRRRQPTGPYYLVGYSIGGTIAYEIARQLLHEGEEVALLGLIDAVNFVRERKTLERVAVTLFSDALAWLRGMSLDYKLAYVTSLVGKRPSWARLTKLLAEQRALLRMLKHYQPEPMRCPTVLFRSKSSRLGVGQDLGWKRLVTEIEILTLDGNHVTILDKHNARRIALRVEQFFSDSGKA